MYEDLKYLSEECSAEMDAEEYSLVVSSGLQKRGGFSDERPPHSRKDERPHHIHHPSTHQPPLETTPRHNHNCVIRVTEYPSVSKTCTVIFESWN
jgi:hypothetical protein